MNLDNAKHAQADILRQVLGFREISDTYSVDDESYPMLVPQYEERVTSQISADGQRQEVVKAEWDRRALIGIGIRTPDAAEASEGFGIAIFCQQKALAGSKFVQEAVKLARGGAQVIVTGPVTAPGPTASGRVRGPLQIGCSVGHPQTTAGTLGCFATLAADMGAISNAHVFAPGLYAQAGDSSLSPGVRDGGRDPADAFGKLTRFEPIDYGSSAVNQVDCAWSRIDEGVQIDQFTLKGVGQRGRDEQLKQAPIAVVARDRVGKIGRTTGITWGEVSAINTNVTVRMHAPGFSRLAAFAGQLSVSSPAGPFSQGGDSGAILFTDQFDPAGLVFAGSSAPDGGVFVTYANPISLVLAALQVSL